ncbi:UNVERIFIED_CONTAM: Eukaryotic translation initiation factor isoform 4E [Sesamum angustifolium]|uniref:Eukaryotic translation initiation factor isoform 4E n=1 Tax=Sesamum angustifolium TaxID=2727405 RepID=A0AAW2LTX5_9LAMI
MASEVAAAASEVPAGAPATAEKQPHKLERKWTFWFDNQSKPKQGAAWALLFARSILSTPLKNFGGT